MADNSTGKVTLVAGGTGGLGRAVTLRFLEDSCATIVTYRAQEEFAALQEAAQTRARSLEGDVVDVTDEDAVRKLTQTILAKHKRIDILVNTVGAYAGGVPLWETDPKVFEQMFRLNVRSGYVLSRVVVPVMLQQGKGAVVNVASRAAVDHAAGAAAYAASKAAALAMMNSLAADLKGTGVRVNTVLPSIIDTEANRKAMPKADFTTWPKPEDIARVIAFLCSDEANLIHGAAIPVYGKS
jgi:NAD(P)-dependent dehydrogenase (short-subunit alcohol dehydrogenase family)